VTNEYAEYWFQEGPDKKFSETGKGRPLKPAERHHHLHCTAGFEIIDAMISFRLIRTGSKELPSYALDAILKMMGLRGKIRIISEEGLSPKEWHDEMQANHRIEYLVYASFDTRSMTLLDAKTQDLKLTLGSLIEECEYKDAYSSTKRVALDFSNHAIREGRVCSARYNYDPDEIEEMDDERRYELGLDHKVIGSRDWILTLPAFMASPDMGIKPFKDYPNWRSQIAIGSSDIDIVSSYPTVDEILNASKETVTKELISIKGIPEEVMRNNNLNLLTGKVSHMRYSIEMYNKISVSEVVDIINQN